MSFIFHLLVFDSICVFMFCQRIIYVFVVVFYIYLCFYVLIYVFMFSIYVFVPNRP